MEFERKEFLVTEKQINHLQNSIKKTIYIIEILKKAEEGSVLKLLNKIYDFLKSIEEELKSIKPLTGLQ